MQKMFDAYATRKYASVEALRFIYKGQRVMGDQTPKVLDLKDNDLLYAHVCMGHAAGSYITLYKYIIRALVNAICPI